MSTPLMTKTVTRRLWSFLGIDNAELADADSVHVGTLTSQWVGLPDVQKARAFRGRQAPVSVGCACDGVATLRLCLSEARRGRSGRPCSRPYLPDRRRRPASRQVSAD